jgi:hypothetical protein
MEKMWVAKREDFLIVEVCFYPSSHWATVLPTKHRSHLVLPVMDGATSQGNCFFMGSRGVSV